MKGDKGDHGNYRPVSMTCVTCRLIQAIIRMKIIDHLKVRKLISGKQYGFMSGRSAVLQLITVLDKWTRTLDEGGGADVAYCEFMKAFDAVTHRRLMKK